MRKTVIKSQKFVFNKLITGGFRIGVSQKTIVNALAKSVQATPSVIAHRIAGNWNPATMLFTELLNEEVSILDVSKPYRHDNLAIHDEVH